MVMVMVMMVIVVIVMVDLQNDLTRLGPGVRVFLPRTQIPGMFEQEALFGVGDPALDEDMARVILRAQLASSFVISMKQGNAG